MAELTKKSIGLAIEVLISYDSEKANEVIRLELAADKYEDKLGAYLVKLSSKNLSVVDSFCMADKEKATHVEPLEEVIDTLSKKIKENHIKRLRKRRELHLMKSIIG